MGEEKAFLGEAQAGNGCALPSVAEDLSVCEYFLKGKSSPEANEDGLWVGRHFVAVIDGATSKSSFRLEGKTSGRWAMELVREAVSGLPADVSMPDAMRDITRRLHDFYVARGLLEMMEAHPDRRLTACGVIYSHARREVWQVGDCVCRIGSLCSYNPKKVDGIMADARAAFNEVMLLEGATPQEIAADDPGRNLILPFLARQARLQNNRQAEYGFPAFDGFPIPLEWVNVFPVEEGEEVVLASDGYPRVFASLEQSEEYLRSLLEEDPLCMRKYKSTKGLRPGHCSFDDRAYIRFRPHGKCLLKEK